MEYIKNGIIPLKMILIKKILLVNGSYAIINELYYGYFDAYLNISRDTVMNWIKWKVCLWHYDVNEVDEWMKNNDSENISDAK